VQREIGDRLAKALLAGEIRDGDGVLVDAAVGFGETGFTDAAFGAGSDGVPSGLIVRRLEPGEIVDGIVVAGSADGSEGPGGSGGSDLSALPGW
jgi:ATP-dependent Clp protease ATP-binding subunit ClpB